MHDILANTILAGRVVQRPNTSIAHRVPGLSISKMKNGIFSYMGHTITRSVFLSSTEEYAYSYPRILWLIFDPPLGRRARAIASQPRSIHRLPYPRIHSVSARPVRPFAATGPVATGSTTQSVAWSATGFGRRGTFV